MAVSVLCVGLLAGQGCRESPTKTLEAGAFALSVPRDWSEGAVVQKVGLVSYPDFGPDVPVKKGFSYRPSHWAFRFPALIDEPQSHADTSDWNHFLQFPQVMIHKSAEWADVLRQPISAITGPPSELRELGLSELKLRVFPHMSGQASFVCLHREIDFRGGRGIRLIFEHSYELGIMGNLTYFFAGISHDETCQVIATIPVTVPGLDGREHLGWSMDRYAELERDFADYEKAAVNWLAERQQQMVPSLADLDSVMQSLQAVTWRD